MGADDESDIGLLNTIKRLLRCDSRILRSRGAAWFCFASEVLYERLRRLGKRGKFDFNVWPSPPQEYVKDFIRGYVDADGYVGILPTVTRRKLKSGGVNEHTYNVLNFKVGSPDRPFVERVYSELVSSLPIPPRKLTCYRKTEGKARDSYGFVYTYEPARVILNWLYYPGCLCLGRKGRVAETAYRDWETDRKSTRLNSSHRSLSRMPSSA